MISMEEKMNFVESLFLFNSLKNKYFKDFFSVLRDDPSFLLRVNFVNGLTNINFKYKLYFNFSNDFFSFEFKGTRQFEKELLISFWKDFNVQDEQVYISICTHNSEINKRLNNVCINYRFLSDIVTDAVFNLAIREVKIKEIKKEIDNSLKNGDKEKFLKLSSKYKEITRAFED